MKKLSLLSLLIAILFGGSVMAQQPQVLINDDFEAYTVGNKLAVEAQAAGNVWWTTWSGNPGSAEDGVIAEYQGTKCGYLTYGVDQVLSLGNEENGAYDLEFDILVPNGKNAYFNILHNFNPAGGNTWAMESYLHMTGSGTASANTGCIMVGGQTINFTVVYDGWMHFRLHVDTDADVAEYYYTAPDAKTEELIHTWTWSYSASSAQSVGRKLAAMDFYPPLNASTSQFYLDNFSYTKTSGDTAPVMIVDTESINTWAPEDDFTSFDLTISNEEGTSMGDWSAWIDFGASQGGSAMTELHWDSEPSENSSLVGFNITSPKSYEAGVMFPGASYAGAAMGTRIVSAQYFMVESTSGFGLEENTPLIFRVYRQGLNGQPGEVLAEKEVPYAQINHEDWTVATFDTPVVLSGFNAWVTVEFTQKVGGYALVMDGDTQVEHGGYERNAGGGAFEPIDAQYGNLHLRANTQGTAVPATWAVLSTTEGSIPMGAEETVTINFNTIGLSLGDSVDAELVILTSDAEHAEYNIPMTLTVDPDAVIENAESAFKVYPNPTNGKVTVEGENIAAIAIYSAAGQLINVVNTTTVDMSAYGTGVYFFNIVDSANNTTVQRVVVK